MSRLGLQLVTWVGGAAGLLLAEPLAAAESPSSGDLIRAVTGMASQSLATPLKLLAIITVLGFAISRALAARPRVRTRSS